jgi:hypothetical protein
MFSLMTGIPWRRERWLFLAVSAVVFAAATMTRADADLWGHVRFGLDILRSHRLPSVDPYSFTQDRPWINHEWLSEVLMGAVWAAGGPAGLALLKGALVFATLVLIWTGLRGVRLGIRLVVLLLVVIGTLSMWATLRPQLWTFICFGVLCRVLVSDRARARWWLPALFVVWVNVHGGWIVGLGVLGAWAAMTVAFPPREWTPWAGVVGACVAATLVNPYGWGLWVFLVRTVRMTRSIQEWLPLWHAPVLNWLPWAAAVVSTIWIVRRRDAGQLRVALVMTILAYASIRVMRIESLFVEAAAILLAPHIAALWPRRAQPDPALARQVETAFSAGAIVVAAVVAGGLLWRSLACIPLLDSSRPDADAVRRLASAGPGRLVTYFDWGEYAIWHLGPRLKVSMDGRRETVYSDARIVEYDAIVVGRAEGLAALDAWRAEYVWLPATSVTTRAWLESHGYRIEVETARSFVAVREDLPRLAIPEARANPSPRCFGE